MRDLLVDYAEHEACGFAIANDLIQPGECIEVTPPYTHDALTDELSLFCFDVDDAFVAFAGILPAMKHCGNCYKDDVRLFIATCDACYADSPDDSLQCESCIAARQRVNNHLVCIRCERPTRVRRSFALGKLKERARMIAQYAVSEIEYCPPRLDLIYFFAFSMIFLGEKYALAWYFDQSPTVIVSFPLAACVFLLLYYVSRAREKYFPFAEDVAAAVVVQYTFLMPILLVVGALLYYISATSFSVVLFCMYALHIIVCVTEWLYVVVIVSCWIRFLSKKTRQLGQRSMRGWRSLITSVVAHEFVEV